MPEYINDRIAYNLIDQVARIELTRTQAGNGLDQSMGEAFHAAARRAADDVDAGAARVVLVTAQGPVFSVGGDLREFAGAEDRAAKVKATADELHAGLAILRDLRAPVVSVINGTAAGGGLGVGLIGDIVIAAAEANLVMAYTAVGLTPDCGLTWMIPNRLSWARTMDLALTNRVLTGAEAADWGLVSRVVPAEDLAAEVEAVVANLRHGASEALASAKLLMSESKARTFAEQLDEEAATISRLVVEPDGVEGLNAFLAKRQPAFL